ncbi:hypothetical protein [Enterobacter kobei]|uniref:hypothetical protein n=1 Tax=Enterobacter kobei TaxID=208224 RepID=UPI000793DE8A|nr:hypothetical protein [Enterobacter kobei]SAF46155.1 Uncharacterised protein [Enterobacter kobei]
MKFTKEHLITRAKMRLAMVAGFPDSQLARMDKCLAEIALASLEADPVYFVEIEGGQDINAGRIEGKNRPDLSLLPDGINHLYAAPQPLNDAERAELQERRISDSADREMLKRLAVILSGSDAPGEIRALTVTAQSFVDRCKTLAQERDVARTASALNKDERKELARLRHEDGLRRQFWAQQMQHDPTLGRILPKL